MDQTFVFDAMTAPKMTDEHFDRLARHASGYRLRLRRNGVGWSQLLQTAAQRSRRGESVVRFLVLCPLLSHIRRGDRCCTHSLFGESSQGAGPQCR